MPNRILKESVCTSDSVDSLTWFEEVLFYRLIVNCDDYGRFDARPAIVKNRLFPLKENLTTKCVSEALNSLASKGLVAMYVFDGKPFLYLPTWNDHQSVRAKKSKYPAPEDGEKASASKCMHMQSDASKCPRNPIQSNAKSECENTTRTKRFAPPTVEQVQAYCRERNNGIDAQRFVDYYSARGWQIGKNAMKDWKAAVRTWEQRSDKPAQNADKNAWMDDFV